MVAVNSQMGVPRPSKGDVMGYETRVVEVRGTVSRHNSQQDIDDDGAWDELIARIEAIAKEHLCPDCGWWHTGHQQTRNVRRPHA